MAVIKKGLVIRKVKNIGISSAFIMTLTSAGVMFSGCNSGGNNDEEYSYEEVSYSKGVISHIKEVKPGEFQITDEESVPVTDAKAIVSYLDGHTDTLSVESSKALIDKEIGNANSSQYHSSGLTSMLLYGGMGYMLGSMMGNNRIAQQRAAQPNGAGFYGSAAAYNKAQAAQQDVGASRSARTVKSRPANSRSGFMGGRGSRSGGG